ncbi:hypothetical protein NP493_440g03033 [Ridgeia piscesae]|uniref:Uncharacterized protein n=1 Tax=Ridgeia piscesae TaxID=27915 RepID=A0AAD9NV14_RIDPI|nr:hypothetical protein NP493_440g03033 [Ridgeia piscesae]
MDELSDKLAQTEATVTQLKSKLLQLQDMNINGEMLINKKQQLVRKLEDQAKQDNSQMMDLQRALDRQDGQLQDKEKALAALRQRLNHLEAQVTREKDGAAQSTARAVEEHQTLAENVKTLEKEAASHNTTVKVGTSCGM